MVEYNAQYFSEADVKNGLHLEFINFLLEKLKTDEYHVDIHIVQESNAAVTVEWIRQLYNYEDDIGKFQFVDGDEYVMKLVEFPDGHYDYAHSEEEAQEMLQEVYKKQINEQKKGTE